MPRNGTERKEKRQAKRAHRKAERALNPFNQPPKSSEGKFDDGLSGSCSAGNLTACKTEVKKTPKFNPDKNRISKSRLVGSKKKRERQELKASTGKTAAGRAIAKVANVFKKNNTDYGNPRFL